MHLFYSLHLLYFHFNSYLSFYYSLIVSSIFFHFSTSTSSINICLLLFSFSLLSQSNLSNVFSTFHFSFISYFFLYRLNYCLLNPPFLSPLYSSYPFFPISLIFSFYSSLLPLFLFSSEFSHFPFFPPFFPPSLFFHNFLYLILFSCSLFSGDFMIFLLSLNILFSYIPCYFFFFSHNSTYSSNFYSYLPWL